MHEVFTYFTVVNKIGMTNSYISKSNFFFLLSSFLELDRCSGMTVS